MISFILDVFFLGSCYDFYVITGYYLNNDILKKIKTRYIIIIMLVTFLFTVWIQYYSINANFIYNVWYNFFPLLIYSICLYELIRRIFDNNKSTLYSNKVIQKGVIMLSKIKFIKKVFFELNNIITYHIYWRLISTKINYFCKLALTLIEKYAKKCYTQYITFFKEKIWENQ